MVQKKVSMDDKIGITGNRCTEGRLPDCGYSVEIYHIDMILGGEMNEEEYTFRHEDDAEHCLRWLNSTIEEGEEVEFRMRVEEVYEEDLDYIKFSRYDATTNTWI